MVTHLEQHFDKLSHDVCCILDILGPDLFQGDPPRPHVGPPTRRVSLLVARAPRRVRQAVQLVDLHEPCPEYAIPPCPPRPYDSSSNDDIDD